MSADNLLLIRLDKLIEIFNSELETGRKRLKRLEQECENYIQQNENNQGRGRDYCSSTGFRTTGRDIGRRNRFPDWSSDRIVEDQALPRRRKRFLDIEDDKDNWDWNQGFPRNEPRIVITLNRDDDDEIDGRQSRKSVRLEYDTNPSSLNKSRDDALAEQNNDGKTRTRNKRMFDALLLGTLNRFSREEKRFNMWPHQSLLPNDEEKASRKEKEEMAQRRKEAIKERDALLLKINRLEEQRDQLIRLEEWEAAIRRMSSFILTETKPAIYFKPKTLNPYLEARLQNSHRFIDELVTAKRRRALEGIDERFIKACMLN